MPDEARLREQARAAIQNGKLPSRAPDRTWGGPGVGAECSVCEKPVTKDEMEFEIQFAHDGDIPWLGQVPRPHPVLRGVGVRAEQAQDEPGTT